MAREVAWLVEQLAEKHPHEYRVACFVDDDPARSGDFVNDVEVHTLPDASAKYPNACYVVAVGNWRARQDLSQKAEAAGLRPATLIAPDVLVSRHMQVGEGTVICPGSILTTNIRIGCYVQINVGCTISHDAVIEDFATLAPGVHVAGRVHIGRGAYLGTGAVIINGSEGDPMEIGPEAVVGAGACVIRSVEPRVTVVGVPARPLPAS